MKNFTAVFWVALIVVLGFLASSCEDKGSEKTTLSAKNQAADGQQTTAKDNSFSVGGVTGKARDSLNAPTAMVDRGKKYLLTQVDSRLAQLGFFKSKVRKMPGLSEAERKSLVSELDAEMAAFEAFKPEINKGVTQADIRNVSEQIKTEWIKSRLSVVRVEKQMLTARETQVIADAETVSVGLQKRIEALKASGKSTEAEEKLLSAYDEKIASAKKNVEFAKEQSDAALTAATAQEKEDLSQGHELWLKTARANTKEAYQMVGKEAHREFSQRFESGGR